MVGFEGGQEKLIVAGPGSCGVENARVFATKGLQQASNLLAALAAVHRWHAHNRLGSAVLAPAPASRGDQGIEVGGPAAVTTTWT